MTLMICFTLRACGHRKKNILKIWIILINIILNTSSHIFFLTLRIFFLLNDNKSSKFLFLVPHLSVCITYFMHLGNLVKEQQKKKTAHEYLNIKLFYFHYDYLNIVFWCCKLIIFYWLLPVLEMLHFRANYDGVICAWQFYWWYTLKCH